MGTLYLLAILGLLGQSFVNAQAGVTSDSVPFPNVTYPGAVDPLTLPGAQSGQTSPPYYPSPWQDGSGGWEAAIQQAREFVAKLTLVEKVNLTTGVGWEGDKCVGNTGSIPRLGFRALCMQDSPVGVRDADFSSVFPAGITIAATWDRSLFYQRGHGMGQEHYGKGVDVQLGPVVGPLGRAPAGGRNWEGFSPDPYLSGVAVGETVKGIQDAGVMACTKHYIGYEQEHFRSATQVQENGTTINVDIGSANMDDRTMHELYLWPFADAVRAGTASVMCSYNQVNNSVACQNSYTLSYLLKGELGFQGFVMSDWAGQHSGVSSALAGLDMTMPGDVGFDSGTSFWGANLTIAVLNGTIPQWRLDDMASRIVAGWYYVGRDKNAPDTNFDAWTTDTYGYQHIAANAGYTLINEHVDVRGEHGTQIRNQAAAGTVLLKNNGALPLTGKEKFIAVFGNDAGDNTNGPNGCSDRGCDNGTLAMAWGSGSANFPYLVTPLTAIQNEVLSNKGAIENVLDNWATSNINALARRVVNSGGKSAAIVFVNADSGEDYIVVDGNAGDRNNLTLWQGGDQLINNVISQCNNTIVVMHTVGAVDVSGFYDNPNVTAIIWAGIPGEQSGNSIADVLYGRINPGGKLPFTIGEKRLDYGTDLLYLPNNGEGPPQEDFTEGVFIDYRSFDRQNITPIYEFGYGLSYTSFSYSNFQVKVRSTNPYNSNKGFTKPAPTLGTIANTSSAYVFPADFKQIPLFVYPYLNSNDLRAASQDPAYGRPASEFTPPNSLNGSSQAKLPAGGAPGGNPSLYDVIYTVTAQIKNTGKVAGDEVIQLYINHGGPDDPKVVLRGFDRITIPAGASRTFTADLVRRDIMNWDTLRQDWVVSRYPKTVYVGASSRKLYLSAKLPTGDGETGW